GEVECRDGLVRVEHLQGIVAREPEPTPSESQGVRAPSPSGEHRPHAKEHELSRWTKESVAVTEGLDAAGFAEEVEARRDLGPEFRHVVAALAYDSSVRAGTQSNLELFFAAHDSPSFEAKCAAEAERGRANAAGCRVDKDLRARARPSEACQGVI